ncbi:bacteriocin-like protein, partial [Elizabethkingia anophelis]
LLNNVILVKPKPYKYYIMKKLSKKELKTVQGAAGLCPAPATTCDEWCNWTPTQKARCLSMVAEICEC